MTMLTNVQYDIDKCTTVRDSIKIWIQKEKQ